jgi:preprotein translocase subunit SecA
MSRIQELKKHNPHWSRSLIDYIEVILMGAKTKYTELFVNLLKQHVKTAYFDFNGWRDELIEFGIDKSIVDNINDFELIYFSRCIQNLIPKHDLTTFKSFIEFNEKNLIGNKDITTIKTFSEVNDLVSLAEMRDWDNELESQVIIELDNAETGWLLLRPLTFESSKKYGSATKWCTTERNSPNYFYRYYKNILVYCINRKTGYKVAKEKLGKRSLYDADDPWILEILNALKAKYVFKLNKDYIVLNNKILIIDEFTGRIMEDRRWSLGIHEAVEVKENVELGGGTKTKTSITYQNFFTLYPKLAGMTGTAKTTEKEFQDIYKLEVIVVPTAKPMMRQDLSDFVYQTELNKWKAVLNKSKECFEKGQPLLIGTASVEKSEFLSDLFKISNLPHQILNAKPENVKRESEVIAQAGKRSAITIATNMAGRGTDIILGGNPTFTAKQKIFDFLESNKNIKEKNLEISLYDKNLIDLFEKVIIDYTQKRSLEDLETEILGLPYSLDKSLNCLQDFYKLIYDNIYTIWEKENKVVKELGGLFVLGTERHETRRIDNQLRGRSGRQGDPGISQFFVSLEDDLIKVFGGDSIKRWVDYLIQDKDVPLESDLLTKSLENAQKKVESYNYEVRKNVFQYDDVLNIQRKKLFQARNEILCLNILNDLFLRSAESFFDVEWEKLEKEKFKSENYLKLENGRNK